MRVPEAFIETVVAKTDLVTIVQERVPLKKRGANYVACCPFHKEKTPSFTVNPIRQRYHCFGCGVDGDAIGFLMAVDQLSFLDALTQLATRLGLNVPKDPKEEVKDQARSQQVVILNEVAAFYHAQLKHPAAKEAIHYLKQRGITGEAAKTFCLGFAPPGWQHVFSYFQGNPSALRVLEETGLIIKHPQGRFYDRFRHRIMFPIRDKRGDVIGFGGRVLDDTQPKYLNSPESSLFQKSHCLYGLKQKYTVAVVVEGYFDVIALTQSGVEGVSATLGTALTTAHLTLLFQQCAEIVFCFDGDKAGEAAAWKALQLVLPFLEKDRHVRFAFLPQGEDPDSYVRKVGSDRFRTFLKNSATFSDYFFATLSKYYSPTSLDGRAQLVNKARPLLAQLPAGVLKEMMFEQLAQWVSSAPQVIRGDRQRQTPRFQVAQKRPQLMGLPYLIGALLLKIPHRVDQVKESIEGCESDFLDFSGMALLGCLLDVLQKENAGEVEAQLEARGFALKFLKEAQRKVALIPLEGLEAELQGAVLRLCLIRQEAIAEKLLQKAKSEPLTSGEKQRLKEILQKPVPFVDV